MKKASMAERKRSPILGHNVPTRVVFISERRAVLEAMARKNAEEPEPVDPDAPDIFFELFRQVGDDEAFMTYRDKEDIDPKDMGLQWVALVRDVHHEECTREAPVSCLSDCPGLCHAVVLHQVIRYPFKKTDETRYTHLLWGDCARSTFFAVPEYKEFLSCLET